MKFFQDFVREISRIHHEELETLIVTKIEEAEGRVPTDAEVAKYGLLCHHPDGSTVVKWKGKEVGRLGPISRLYT
jgi:hypothetical protein